LIVFKCGKSQIFIFIFIITDHILCVAACSLPWEVGNYTVCDNVDLKMVLTEFESYHQVSHTPQI
jgi:hypothetical protein